MKWRMHGANPEKLYKQFNIEKPDNIIDFSTNTNVLDFNIDLNIDLKDLMQNYPDDESIDLRNIIAKQNNISIDNILMANGTNEAIYLIASYYQNKKVGMLQPTFSEYEKALISYNAEVKYLFDISEITYDLDALFICNPNNPTGKYFAYNEILSLGTKLKEMNIDLIIDEAYVDFLNVNHKVIDINEFENVYILRSLTKIFHLSGLRVGYVLSNPNNLKKLKLRQPTWSLNSVAQTIAIRFLEDNKLINETKVYYSGEKDKMISNIKDLGYTVLNSDVNYFLVEIDDDTDLIKFLLHKGIVVRHTRNFPSLDGKFIRIAVRKKEENDILISALSDYIRSK